MADNSNRISVNLTTNNVIVTNTDDNQLTVIQPLTDVVQVNSPGPQGAAGLPTSTGSFATTGSNVFIGNQTVTGSVYITGSLYMNGSKQFNHGAFSSTQTQTLVAGVSGSMTYNIVDVADGVTLVNNSRLSVPNVGVYNIQFSAQLDFYAGADDVYIWLKKNGTNVDNSATVITMDNNKKVVAAWNWVYPLATSDYVEIAWQTTNAHARILANTSPGTNVPAIPSVIVTVTQVA